MGHLQETSAWARLQDAKTGAANAASAACAARATLASGALQRLRRGAASAYEALEGPEMTSNVTQDLQDRVAAWGRGDGASGPFRETRKVGVGL